MWYKKIISQLNTKQLAKDINNPFAPNIGPLEAIKEDEDVPIDDQYSYVQSPLQAAMKGKTGDLLDGLGFDAHLGKARTHKTPLGVDEDGDGIIDQPPMNMNAQYPETVRQDKKGPTQDMMPNSTTHWHNS
jgi:hypothetical protein